MEISAEFAWNQLVEKGLVENIWHEHIKTIQVGNEHAMLFRMKKEYKCILDAQYPADSIIADGKELMVKSMNLDILKDLSQDKSFGGEQMLATKRFIDTSNMINLSRMCDEHYKMFMSEYMDVPVLVTFYNIVLIKPGWMFENKPLVYDAMFMYIN